MKYSLKIIEFDTKSGFWDTKKKEIIFEKWKILSEMKDKGFIVSNNKEVNFIDFKGNQIWQNSINCFNIPNSGFISDNRLIITTNSENYNDWGHLGPVFLIDLDKGKIIKELKGQSAESLVDGRFILGLEGYSMFNTWLYDSNGNLLQEWKSFGHYLVNNNEIYVIENDRRIPTSSKIVQLNFDGTIKKSIQLKSSESSNPILLKNNDFIFVNTGELKIIGTNLIEIDKCELLHIEEKDSWRFSFRISLEQNILIVEILESSEIDSTEYKIYNWLIEIN
jgi:hypothetical protein